MTILDALHNPGGASRSISAAEGSRLYESSFVANWSLNADKAFHSQAICPNGKLSVCLPLADMDAEVILRSTCVQAVLLTLSSLIIYLSILLIPSILHA